MARLPRILLAILFTVFCAAVIWQLFSRFAGGPMHHEASRRPADSAFFAPH